MRRQKDKSFTDEERRAIVKEYLDLGPGRWKRRISEKYGISGHCTLHKWIKQYVKDGEIVPETPEEAFERQMKQERKKLIVPKETKPKKIIPSQSEIEKDKEILRLRTELERERTMTLALNRMIDLAEQELNISIRKKSGAKQ